MTRQQKLASLYESSDEINDAFIETIMRIQKVCKSNQELTGLIEEYYKDKTKFIFSIPRSTENIE